MPVTGSMPCPWPRCCRPRSSCSAGRRRGGGSGRAAPSRRGPRGHDVMRPIPPAAPPTRSASMRPAYPERPYAVIGSGSSPMSARRSASIGRTSVLYASMTTAFAPSTSPAACAASSAGWSTSSAFAVDSWTFRTNYPGQDDIRGRQDRLAEALADRLRPARAGPADGARVQAVRAVVLHHRRAGLGHRARALRRARAEGEGGRRHRPPRAGHEHRVHRRDAAAARASSAASTSTRGSTPTTT